MDIEGHEWGALQHMMDHDLLKGIQQIAVEVHETEIAKMTHEDVRTIVQPHYILRKLFMQLVT